MAPLVLGARAVGPAHERSGTPCQDAFAWAVLSAEAVVVAVADGAGSAAHAEEGARLAVEAAVASARGAWLADRDQAAEALGADHATAHGPDLAAADLAAARATTAPDPDLGAPAVAAAHATATADPDPAAHAMTAAHAAAGAVRARAHALPARPRDLACTLIVVIWSAGRVAVAHIGDGAVAGWRPEGGWEMLSQPGESEYVNETRFLTDPDWSEHLRVTVGAARLVGLVAFTDGCQRAALLRDADGRPQPFPGFLDPLARFGRRACAEVAAAAVERTPAEATAHSSAPDPGPDDQPPPWQSTQGDPGDAAAPLQRLLHSAKLRDASDDDKTLLLIWRDATDG